MNRHLFLLFLVSLAVLLVKSETTIEVDENGDEYEVKRFNIQGRQLNEGRSQCIEIRRKRAAQSQSQPQPQPLYFDDGSNDELENKNDEDNPDAIQEDDAPDLVFYAPPVISAPATVADDEEQVDADITMNEMNTEKMGEMTLNTIGVNNNTKSEGTKEKGNDDTVEVIQLPQLSVLGEAQSAGEPAVAIASASTSASASSYTDAPNTEGIAVVHSHRPPKVNPQTHAVFELIPVDDVITVADYGDDNEYDNIPTQTGFEYNEEPASVSTTYTSSTSDDGSNDVYDDGSQVALRVQKVKNSKNPNNKHRETPAMKPKHKNKARLPSDNKTEIKRPNKTPKKPAANKNRRPNINKPTANRVPNKNKTPHTENSLPNNRHRYNGEYPFGPMYAWTGVDDDQDYGGTHVDCIIIRKESPSTTTERPFWKFWGRSAGGARPSGQFGMRKRVDLRFAA